MAVAVRRPPERSALLLVCFSLLIVGGFFSPYIAAHQRLSWSGTPRTAACGPPRLTLAANLSFVNAAFPSALETMYHAGVYRAADAAYHFAVRVVDTESSSRLAYFQLDEDFRMAGAGPEVLDTSASPGLQSHGATGPEDPRAVLDPLGNVIYTFHQPHGGGGRVHRPQASNRGAPHERRCYMHATDAVGNRGRRHASHACALPPRAGASAAPSHAHAAFPTLCCSSYTTSRRAQSRTSTTLMLAPPVSRKTGCHSISLGSCSS